MSASASAGENASTAGAPASTVSTATACGWTVSSFVAPWSRASSSRLPPQRTRVTVAGSPGVASMQFADIGRSAFAATCAITSLPRSVPGPTTAAGASRRTSSTRLCPSAAGAYEEKTSCSATWSLVAPWAPSSPASDVAPTPVANASTGSARRVPAREGQRLSCRVVEVPALVLDVDEDRHLEHPQLLEDGDDGRSRLGAGAQDLRLLALARGQGQADLLDHGLEPGRAALGDGLLLCPQAARYRWIARQVQALLDGDDGGQRKLVDVAASRRPPARTAPARR